MPTDPITTVARGLNPPDAAKRYRVSEDKVRAWIKNNELRAINTASTKCGKPRYVIPPEALAEFEQRRSAAEPPKSRPRKRRAQGQIDFFPDA